MRRGQPRVSADRAERIITMTEEPEEAGVDAADAFRVTHTLDDGIERIVYTPRERRFETPLLMQHGMWHGAWCWKAWQFRQICWEPSKMKSTRK